MPRLEVRHEGAFVPQGRGVVGERAIRIGHDAKGIALPLLLGTDRYHTGHRRADESDGALYPPSRLGTVPFGGDAANRAG